MPATLREDTTQLASTVKGRVRVAMEQRLQAAARDGALRSVVIRAGDFFGGGAGTWFDTVIVKDLPRGRVTWPDALEVPTAWAYLPDLARCFVQVAQQRHALPAFETLHFGGYSVTGQQWVHALSGIARERGWLAPGAQCKVRHLPWPLMRIFGLFSARFAALAPMRYLWQTPHQLTNARLLALIGQEPHTPLLDAARAALAELHVAGEKQARVAPLAATAKPAPRAG
jgi:nucleoside-diphosphate-sugar epimerase